MTRVLYAHPDRWTIGAEFPPEERERMRKALAGFAAEWLAWQSPAKIEHSGAAVEESDEQRRALGAWRDRAKAVGARARRFSAKAGRGIDAHAFADAALEAVVCGALWESPVFRAERGALSFHRAWRIVLDIAPNDERALAPLAARWKLLVRNK